VIAIGTGHHEREHLPHGSSSIGRFVPLTV